MASGTCAVCGASLLPGAEGCAACAARLAITEAQSTLSAPVAASIPTSRVGSYKILQTIGEGGMGLVYLAEQEQPFRRRVALKVIKIGMDTRAVVARFEAERQALALMNHPCIAKVFDAGTGDDGRPYFAMEYVAGIPITDYCDKHCLSTKARLELFVHVCGAIQHAHQKGVIHRDIKPSNVLVAVQDGKPLPKVIDFGVAKAIHQHLTEKTVFTQLGLLIGTPAYMSPEQAERSGLDVDTTTDIYSLGVLLYELLIGALPFDPAVLRSAGYAEIQRIIREEEPLRPSARLSSLRGTASAVAKQRHAELGALARELRGDLDWITLKAMDKDRTRRYASASELAADVSRHLNKEPVLARPASVLYRAHKFVMKHRGAVIAAAAVILALAAAGYAYRRYLEIEKQLSLAEDFFYWVKVLDVNIAHLGTQVAIGGVDTVGAVKQYRRDRREMERTYDQYVARYYERNLDEADRIVLRVTRRFGECDLLVPKDYVETVKTYIIKWQTSGQFTRALKVAQEKGYVRHIVKEFMAQDLPPQFFYLAMQESGFDAVASGPQTTAGIAKGMWQFMPATGARYGLTIGPLAAERTADAEDGRHKWDRSTVAAAAYIKDIYSTDAQASGLLVMASYNWGENRVLQMIRSLTPSPKERNFWKLLERYRQRIPRETYDYVFSIVAAAAIGENPRVFGFSFDNPIALLEAEEAAPQ